VIAIAYIAVHARHDLEVIPMRMRWRGLELPARVVRDEAVSTGSYGRFIIEPFEQGFGTTIGNSLRRVLLSSLEGAAVTSVKIAGVTHEFRSIEGILEDVTDILLNIKGMVLRLTGADEKKMTVRRDRAGEIRAGDFTTDPAVIIANPDHKIATLTANVPFECELTVRGGRGYATVADNRGPEQELGVIPVDSIFSPVLRVRYRTEDMRVGQRTNYDRLIMEVWTKGTVRPEDALVEAALILRKHLNPFVMYHDLGDELVSSSRPLLAGDARTGSSLEELLDKPISVLNLSVRATNCLDAARVLTLRDLIGKSESDLLRFRSFGKTSLHEVERKLADVGLSLGMQLGADVEDEPGVNPGSGLVGSGPAPLGSAGDEGDLASRRRGATGPMEVFTMGD
jgi:DNA-directed RNA polymerase subunit alpha